MRHASVLTGVFDCLLLRTLQQPGFLQAAASSASRRWFIGAAEWQWC
jgi:hypothetical protein